MRLDEVVIEHKQINHVLVVVERLGEAVGPAGTPAWAHSDRQVATLGAARDWSAWETPT